MPFAVTNCNADTDVARLPFLAPEPCVAVLMAPATVMSVSDARFASAKPRLSSHGHSWLYLMPASTVTVSVFLSSSSATALCNGSKDNWVCTLSAIVLKEWPVPSTVSVVDRVFSVDERTKACTRSTEFAEQKYSALKTTFPDQLVRFLELSKLQLALDSCVTAATTFNMTIAGKILKKSMGTMAPILSSN